MAFTIPLQRGASALNKEAFGKTIKVLAVRVPAKNVGVCLKALAGDLLNQPKLQNVAPDESKETKKLLLNVNTSADLSNLPASSQTYIKEHGLGVVEHEVHIGYDYWTTDEVLRAILPPEIQEVPTSFTTVGHIAHMNLREEFQPWKHIIGQVILDKNKNITSVINKLDTIDSTFRNFRLEVLAGTDDMVTEVRESNCRFQFDFSKVYWNSRLHTEHDRLVSMFHRGDLICDVFAGVGPFAIPAARKGCLVYANDLNPDSFTWLRHNMSLNKIRNTIKPYNLDGRDFIKQAKLDLDQAVKDGTLTFPASPESNRAKKQKTNDAKAIDAVSVADVNFKRTKNGYKTFDHIVMNLPAISLEFLDAFRGIYKDEAQLFDDPTTQLPMMHAHCFSKSAEPEQDILERVTEAMGRPISTSETSIHWVRKVAPNKDMYCISFRLGADVAFS
ncbi:hypothetical protein BZG36_02604 [Bifiguratus adelaidae]|uniref:tRNA (guanine(37)-N1)-methyltransferase n=1 Tax=Bifiguratus adelaidae TaxID=1938954 RepID=A0A261Y2R1_9FUNG|nr:hypothetical protein BZG36_02604 [Bifiguratus adelaidae]